MLTQTNPPPTISPARLGAGAIILGGDCGAVGAVRSLGRAGIPSIFLRGRNPLAAYSRYTTQSLAWPGAQDPEALAWLKNLAAAKGLAGWLLVPAADEEVRFISHHHAELSAVFRLCTPPWQTTRWLADKALTYQKAAELGIAYPKTYQIVQTRDLAAHELNFPLVLKPAVKSGDNALTQAKIWRVFDRDKLMRVFDEASAMAGDEGLIIQELVPGDGATQFSYAAVCDNGRPVASLVALRLRQLPANYGTGTFVQTVDNAEVEAQAERWLQAVGYSGMVEMEFKHDTRDGSFKLLDVNPRIWTWVSIGNVTGVDFPLTMWRLAQGERLPRLRARPGGYWMYLSRDFLGAMKEIFAGRLSLIDYIRGFFRPVTFATFAMDDPKPWLIDWPTSLLRWLAKGSRR